MLISVCCTYQRAQADAARDWRRETTVAALSSFDLYKWEKEGTCLYAWHCVQIDKARTPSLSALDQAMQLERDGGVFHTDAYNFH